VSLHQDDGLIEGHSNLLNYITKFYKTLFGRSERTNVTLDLTGVEKIDEADCVMLTEIFSLKELKEAVFGMELNKAADPDGFNADLYQKFWPLVYDMFQLVNDFFDKKINVDRLNFGVVTLVPKGANADKIQKYRPICLLNVIFKIITKMIVNRLIKVIWKVIKIMQTAFLKIDSLWKGSWFYTKPLMIYT
jgi:hypothetical protein